MLPFGLCHTGVVRDEQFLGQAGAYQSKVSGIFTEDVRAFLRQRAILQRGDAIRQVKF